LPISTFANLQIDSKSPNPQIHVYHGAVAPTPTQPLTRASGGDERAIEKLMPLVYDELRRLAASYLRRERPGQTLQATALVNEAYVRLISERAHNWQNRTHFVAIAALSMRQILVQRARRRHAVKRGGDPERITLDEQLLPAARAGSPGDVDVLALDAALDQLAKLDERQAKVVEMRYFGGLTVEETAEALGISPATVKREWTLARAWLKRELTGSRSTDDGR
jgi:RNA polymerase sigma factor (TIGR02999 family)